jgi:hypothetical protein
MVPVGTKATLHSSHDDQEAQALLLGALHLDHIRSALGMRPSNQGSYGADRSMGSGDWPV